MSKLTTDARDLIEAARAGEQPTPRARARVRAKVFARVGAGAALGAAVSSSTLRAAGSSAWGQASAIRVAAALKWLPVAFGLAGGIAVGFGIGRAPPAGTASVVTIAPHASASAESPTVAPSLPKADASDPPAVRTPPPEAVHPDPSLGAMEKAVEAPAAASFKPRSPPAAAASASSLEAEVKLLEGALAADRAGHHEEALAALDELDTKFARGILHEEGRGAHILTLCALGRTSEAHAEAARFLAQFPRSPMADRVRASCGGQASPEPSASSTIVERNPP